MDSLRDLIYESIHFHIYFILLVLRLCQKQFSQKLQFCEGGTILNKVIEIDSIFMGQNIYSNLVGTSNNYAKYC